MSEVEAQSGGCVSTASNVSNNKPKGVVNARCNIFASAKMH